MICAHANKWRKWHHKWSHSCLGMGLNCLVRLVKKHWTGALLNVKCCCFVQKRSWKSHTILNQPVCRKRRRRRKRFWKIFVLSYIVCPHYSLHIESSIDSSFNQSLSFNKPILEIFETLDSCQYSCDASNQAAICNSRCSALRFHLRN